MSVIEHVMMDVRNSSSSYWRERHADTVIDSNINATTAVANSSRDVKANGLPQNWVMEVDHMSKQEMYYNQVMVRLPT